MQQRHPLRVYAGIAVAALTVLPGLAACSAAGAAGPADAANAFWGEVRAGNGEAVCSLLAPATREQVASDAEQECESAVVAGQVGTALREASERAGTGDATVVTVAGRQAQAVTGEEVIFLTRSGANWLVTAAACTPRPDRPYDCEVEN